MASTFNKRQLQLVLQIFERDFQLDICETVQLYKIPYSILSHRINGCSIYTDTIPNLQKLTVLKEEVVVQEVLDLDSRGFPSWIYDMEDIINRLLAIYDATYIGPR